jgi:Ca-activated chloride channel family protein
MFLHALVISGRIIKPQRIAISWTSIISRIIVCACSGIVAAKQQFGNSRNSQNEQSDPQAIIDRVALTTLHISVFDRDGKLVDGLDHDAFEVFEDDVRQKTLMFSHDDEPAFVGFVIQSSGALASKIAATTEAARRFIQASNPKDKFFTVDFSDRTALISTAEELQAFLEKQIGNRQTSFLDAPRLGLVQQVNTHNIRKALLIISDGGDNSSRYDRDILLQTAKIAGAPVYALFVSPNALGVSREKPGKGQDFLAEICKLTGGSLVRVNELSDLPELAAQFGVELRKQYSLGYYPANAGVRWRKIEVKVQSKGVRGPLKVYAPPGYIYSYNGNVL